MAALNKNNFLTALISVSLFINVQIFAKGYNFNEIYDQEFGIEVFTKYDFLVGDSIRTQNNIPVDGWKSDYYTTGKLVHKGYYAEGKLITYKNYFPDGSVERELKCVGLNKYELNIYFPNHKIKSNITFFNKAIQKQTDFYANGNVDFYEEYNKDCSYLTARCSYNENGKLISEFKLVNKKKKIYSLTEYYDNGNVKETGILVYDEQQGDYFRDGIWESYSENQNTGEKAVYVAGKLN